MQEKYNANHKAHCSQLLKTKNRKFRSSQEKEKRNMYRENHDKNINDFSSETMEAKENGTTSL